MDILSGKAKDVFIAGEVLRLGIILLRNYNLASLNISWTT